MMNPADKSLQSRQISLSSYLWQSGGGVASPFWHLVLHEESAQPAPSELLTDLEWTMQRYPILMEQADEIAFLFAT